MTNDQYNELLYCSDNPVNFSKYIKVITPISGIVDLELYSYQKILLNEFNDDNKKHVFSFNSRQMGGTTLTIIQALWYAMYHPNKHVAYISPKMDNSSNIHYNMKYMYQSIPEYLKPGIKTYNKKWIDFDNGSTIHIRSCSADCLRSHNVDLLILDDFAFVSKIISRQFWFANWPIISNKKVIINTCMNNNNQLLKDIWNNGGDHWKRLFTPWSIHPLRDSKWKQDIQKSMNSDESRFKQEYIDFGIDIYSNANNEIAKMWTWIYHLKELNKGKVIKI